MNFTSLFFVFIYLPVFLCGYFILALIEKKNSVMRKYRLTDIYLILMSLVFYIWYSPKVYIYVIPYILLIYTIRFLIDRWHNQYILSTAILAILGILVMSKYVENNIPVLLGISFLSFSAISYLVDSYRRDINNNNLIDCAMYMLFFPKIISGPIILWKDFSRQIHKRVIRVQKVCDGLCRIILGIGKKVLIADYFNSVLNIIEKNMSTGIDISTAWLFAFIYMLEIYFDFSAYSDIAIGISKSVGFELSENFNFPYISSSITEFWRRWHISLGTWFKEYVYIPLGGNRKGTRRTLINITIVFVLTGIWHGVGLGYFIWGCMHGICRLFEKVFEKSLNKVPTLFRWFITMFVVMLGWLIFKFDGLHGAAEMMRYMFGLKDTSEIVFQFAYYINNKLIVMLLIAFGGAVLYAMPGIMQLYDKVKDIYIFRLTRYVLCIILFLVSFVAMVNTTHSPFIYFRY